MKHSLFMWAMPALLATQAAVMRSNQSPRETAPKKNVQSGRWRGMSVIAMSCMLLAGCDSKAPVTPDFTGVWESYPPVHEPAKAPEDLFTQGTGDAYVKPGGEPQLKEPYASTYKARQEKMRENNNEPIQDSGGLCLPAGMPAMMIAVLPIEIVQTPKLVVVLAEDHMEVRRIRIDQKMPPLDEVVPGYYGYSVGHWDGDTLVVETRGIRDDILFLDIPHSNKATLTERIRLTAADKLEVKFHMEDPDVLNRPYEFVYTYKKNPTYQIAEYVCENDRYSGSGTGQTLDTRPKD